MDQFTFKRYEVKYLVTREQKERLKAVIRPYVQTNEYSFSTIRNIYYDTEDFRLARTSLDKPLYKEKLRMRSYQYVGPQDKVFVEIKKKYDSVVYKRRLSMKEADAVAWLDHDASRKPESQIGNEIEYFCNFYKSLRPAVYLSYDREAYEGITDKNFRVTFDTRILARTDRVSLEYEPGGLHVLDPDLAVLELKVAGAYPLWLADFLAQEKIYHTSYSKYGTVYKEMILSGSGHLRKEQIA